LDGVHLPEEVSFYQQDVKTKRNPWPWKCVGNVVVPLMPSPTPSEWNLVNDRFQYPPNDQAITLHLLFDTHKDKGFEFSAGIHSSFEIERIKQFRKPCSIDKDDTMNISQFQMQTLIMVTTVTTNRLKTT
jgi:hypothetical protein